MDSPHRGLTARRRFWVVVFALVSLVVMAGGLAYYRYETDRILQEKYQNLAAIADLKVRQIQEWRREQLNDARSMVREPWLGKAITAWLRDPGNPDLQAALLERFQVEKEREFYGNVLLTDLDGRILLSVRPAPAPLSPAGKQALDAAIAGRQVVLGDLFRCPQDNRGHLDMAVPILDPQGRPLAVVVLRVNADKVLYPLIQFWPTPSPTAETLLVELDGKNVLYLNDLRHREKTALSLREPLTETELPAVQAVQGKQGIFEGKDYRGQEVLADLRPVPQTPWFMIAKVDRAEILAEARYHAQVTFLFVGLFILLAAAVTAYGYRRRQVDLVRDLYRTKRKQRQAQEEFRTTLYSIGDAVITTDTAGLVKQMNQVAERLTGWLEAEARGRPHEEIFHILNEETRTPVENPVDRVLREGQVEGLANHILLIARDGAEHPIADSGAPIRDESGVVLGVVLVFRDQTQERVAEKALQESEKLYRSLFNSMLNGFAYSKMLFEQNQPQDFIYLKVNNSFEELTGLKNVVGKKVSEVIPGIRESDPELIEIYGRVALTGNPERFETYVEALKMWFSISVYSPEKEYFVAIFEVITERKQAEEALRESEQKFRLMAETIQDVFWLGNIGGGKIAYVSPAYEQVWGRSRESLYNSPQSFFEAIHPEDRERVAATILGDHSRESGFDYEYRIIRPDGTTRWIHDRGFPIRNEQGEIQLFTGLARDITERRQAEEALRASEERYRTVADYTYDMEYWINEDLKVVYMSPSCERFTGYPAQAFLDDALLLQRIVHPQDRDLFVSHGKEAYSGAESLNLDFRLIHQNGQEIWVSHSCQPVFGKDGRPLGRRASNRDITERKLVESALREGEEKYRLLVKQIPAVVFQGYGDWSVDFFDDKIEFLSGYTKEEFDSRKIKWCDLILPEDLDQARHTLIDALKTNKSYLREYRIRRKDGVICWIQAIGQIFCDATGKVEQVSGVFFDITEHKQADNALLNYLNLLETLLDTIPNPIFYKNTKGIYLGCNQALSDFLGLPKNEIIGKSVYDIYPKEQADKYFEMDSTLFQQPGVQIYDFSMRHTDGTIHEINFNKATYCTADGTLAGLVGVMVDITDRKKAEVERLHFSKLESLGTMAGGIAHDFNNILTAILGNISLVRLDPQDEKATRKRLHDTERACQKAQRLAQQLLTFAKGGTPIKELVSVENLVTETGSFACRGSKTRCTFSFPNNLWAVEVDPGQISQVIQNLIINAIQAMPTGGIIKVQGENLVMKAESGLPLGAGKYVKISIQDQGVGITADHLSRIFDPYFSTKQTGSGLGLATAHSIVGAHDGHISVESTLEVGTTFHIYLPAVARKIIALPDKGMGVLTGQGKILVMDDEEMVRNILGTMLSRLGYEAKLARDGAEAIELFTVAQESRDAFAAVILDLTVPGGMGGKETIEKLLKIDPQVKAIVSSGYSDDPIMADFQKYGVSGVLTKPYKVGELSKILQRVISKKGD